MKEAIEILEYINIREEVLNKQRISNSISITDLSFNCQLFELARLRDFILGENYHTWQPSEDTPYKKSLTAWIEKKNQAESPYSIFESWQKAKDDALITGRGAVKVSLDSNNEMEVKHVDILDHEEGEE